MISSLIRRACWNRWALWHSRGLQNLFYAPSAGDRDGARESESPAVMALLTCAQTYADADGREQMERKWNAALSVMVAGSRLRQRDPLLQQYSDDPLMHSA